jgi:hypothetical protein
MDMKMKLGIGAVLVAGLGIGAIGLLVKNGGEAFGELAVVEGVAAEAVEPAETTKAQKDFQSMAAEVGEVAECRVPRPPKDLASKAYIRNSYAAILEILAMQRWQETGSCGCFYNEISWDDVVSAAVDFERTDGIALRFDFPELRTRADILSAEHSELCSE